MIDFVGTCDLAIWCKVLHDKGWTGPRIARAIAKSEGYVNNLIRVVERASPSVLLRWRAEQGGAIGHACATDWLVSVCILPHDRQDEELRRRVSAVTPADWVQPNPMQSAMWADGDPDATHPRK